LFWNGPARIDQFVDLASFEFTDQAAVLASTQ
jgi:hypothetical protein